MERNEGIIQRGGSLQAGALAVGRGASAVQQVDAAAAQLERDGEAEVARRLRDLTELIQTHAAGLQQPDDVLSSAGLVADEIARPEPNRLTVSALLEGISRAAGGVTGIAAAVTALRAALGF
jgi:hypothetical protein